MSLSEKTINWLTSEQNAFYVKEIVSDIESMENRHLENLRTNVGQIDDFSRGSASALKAVTNILKNKNKVKIVSKPRSTQGVEPE